jgi:hypothetical protein
MKSASAIAKSTQWFEQPAVREVADDVTQTIDDAVRLGAERHCDEIDVEPFRPAAMGELAPPLAAVTSEAHEGIVAFPDVLLVAEPTDGCGKVKLELLTLDGGANGNGILVAELGHPLRLPIALGWVVADPTTRQ